MGVYIYKLTAKVVTLENGTTAQVAKFAYKPSWSDEAYNRKMNFRTGLTRNIKVKADNIALLDEVRNTATVFANPNNSTSFYDSDFGTDKFPTVGRDVAVVKSGKKTLSIDALIKYHTAFLDLDDMLNTHQSYRPSINCITNKKVSERKELAVIADAYDLEMIKRNDSRRAYRF